MVVSLRGANPRRAIEGKNTMENMLTHKCPICKTELCYTDYGLYCDCGYHFPNRVNNKEITEEELLYYETNGFTPILRFITKKGKPCKVRLMLNRKDRKVDYCFE